MKMQKTFDRQTLTKIIDSNYPTETKVAEIISLQAQYKTELLNKISNRIGHVIDIAKDDE